MGLPRWRGSSATACCRTLTEQSTEIEPGGAAVASARTVTGEIDEVQCGTVSMTAERGPEKAIAIIQARMTSNRLPRKVALDIHGKCLLERVIGQVRRARTVNEIVVATSTSADDEIVELVCRRLSVDFFRGALTDVRSRFVAVGRERKAAIVVRVTADNPLTEPVFIDALVETLRRDPAVHYCTMVKERIPDGSQAEAFRLAALDRHAGVG